MTIYIDIAMSITEEVSWMSKSGYNERNYWNIYFSTMTRLNVNLMEMSIKNPNSAIIIFAWVVN